MLLRAWPLLLLLSLPQAEAHEVRLSHSEAPATVLSLHYADGQPFAFEAYELYLPGKSTPEQVGRTSAQGQIVFLAGPHTEWRLKAYSSDGHGVDQTLSLTPTDSTSPAAESGRPSRLLLLWAGLGTLFGLFGLIQLFVRKKP